jgi:hypothetical protein
MPPIGALCASSEGRPLRSLVLPSGHTLRSIRALCLSAIGLSSIGLALHVLASFSFAVNWRVVASSADTVEMKIRGFMSQPVTAKTMPAQRSGPRDRVRSHAPRSDTVVTFAHDKREAIADDSGQFRSDLNSSFPSFPSVPKMSAGAQNQPAMGA